MKKKILIISLIIVVLLSIGVGAFLFINKQNSYSYTIEEEKWLEKNKNNVLDIYMPSSIAVLTESGEGLFFDFVKSFSENTGIKLNPLAYQLGNEVSSDHSILLVDKEEENDIVILEDEYVVISKELGIYTSIENFIGKKIGILKKEEELIKTYLGENLTYEVFETDTELLTALSSDNVNYIVGLKYVYLNQILTKEYHISYHISNLKKKYVLRLNNSNEEINSIIKKEYQKFKKNNYTKSYNNHLLNTYVNAFKITEQELANLNSKKYTYGYINNGIYDNTFKGKLSGTNYFIIKNFASFANIDMKYSDEFSSIKELNDNLENNKIDFYFDNTNLTKEENKRTVLPIKSKIVLLVRNDDKSTINSLKSLQNKEVAVLENSKIQKYLEEKEISIKTYKNYKEMFKKKNLSKNLILAIELDNYEYYKSRGLNNYHIGYIVEDNQNYGFVVSNDNELFYKLLNSYLEFVDINSIINIEYVNVYEYEGLNIFLLIAVIVLLGILILQFFGKMKKAIVFVFKRKNNKLTKDEKLKYIDGLTSLKNRTYLNANIEKWDNSEIYPQIIVIIDLNNISYINDNFGHEEGDKVISEAANILIQTQLSNTEIIRTDGNEFLVYMIDYEEKKAVSYIRKLNREFKNLTHGFGAAIGYSIINDAIKTIDDAVNEATLDMKNNKELMYEEDK